METVVVVFAGEYDVASKERLRAELERLVSVQDLILDFRDVTYIDSIAVTELVRMHKLRAENLFERETIVTSGFVRRLFDLLELKKVFRLVDTVDEALVGPRANVRYAFKGASQQR